MGADAPLLKGYLRKRLDNDVDAFFAEQVDRIVHVHGRLPLIDLRDEPVLQEFLSGQSDARHFNSVGARPLYGHQAFSEPRKTEGGIRLLLSRSAG